MRLALLKIARPIHILLTPNLACRLYTVSEDADALIGLESYTLVVYAINLRPRSLGTELSILRILDRTMLSLLSRVHTIPVSHTVHVQSVSIQMSINNK